MQDAIVCVASWFVNDRTDSGPEISPLNELPTCKSIETDSWMFNTDWHCNIYADPGVWKDRGEVHRIGGIPSQLRPATWFRELWNFPPSDHLRFLWQGIVYGFPIVDDNVTIPSYDCRNYNSAQSGLGYDFISKLFSKELEENKLIFADDVPDCIHAIGAVPKGKDKFRPITDSVPSILGGSKGFNHFNFEFLTGLYPVTNIYIKL